MTLISASMKREDIHSIWIFANNGNMGEGYQCRSQGWGGLESADMSGFFFQIF